MDTIQAFAPLGQKLIEAIKAGDIDTLSSLLDAQPQLASTGIDDGHETVRSLLHIATDWPGHYPRVGETIRILIEAGADVNVRLIGSNRETPLHWAASSNDVEAIDALLNGGADMDMDGAVIAGGDPLENAIGFQKWDAARRLVERGATTRMGDEAALGLVNRIQVRFDEDDAPTSRNITYSFWNACCAGQLKAAQFLHEKGADINWIPDWCDDTPLDGATQNGNEDLIAWLEANGALRNTTAHLS